MLQISSLGQLSLEFVKKNSLKHIFSVKVKNIELQKKKHNKRHCFMKQSMKIELILGPYHVINILDS